MVLALYEALWTRPSWSWREGIKLQAIWRKANPVISTRRTFQPRVFPDKMDSRIDSLSPGGSLYPCQIYSTGDNRWDLAQVCRLWLLKGHGAILVASQHNLNPKPMGSASSQFLQWALGVFHLAWNAVFSLLFRTQVSLWMERKH